MMIFNNMMLLYELGDIYGNDRFLIQQIGRLVIVYETNKGVTCFVLNTADIPISPFRVRELREECLTGKRTFKSAFNICDCFLSNEQEVSFQKVFNGLFCIKINSNNLIPMDDGGGEVYNSLVREVDNADDGEMSSFKVFKDLVELKNSTPTTKVLIHNNPTDALKMTANYGLILDIECAGYLVNNIPYFWEIYYEKTLEFNPMLMMLISKHEKKRPVILK